MINKYNSKQIKQILSLIQNELEADIFRIMDNSYLQISKKLTIQREDETIENNIDVKFDNLIKEQYDWMKKGINEYFRNKEFKQS